MMTEKGIQSNITEERARIAPQWLLRGPFFPKHNENRMNREGDLENARKQFLRDRFPNLDYLLKTRYQWMNAYLTEGKKVLELGCGAGFSPLYLKLKPILTDVVSNEWVERVIDATDMALGDGSVDVLILSHIIHHFSSPYVFFQEALRVLKPGGYLLIQDIQTSLMMRILLRLMRHEGWSYDVDVFDIRTVANDPDDPWSANCAIPHLLFCDGNEFVRKTRQKNAWWSVVENRLTECFIFPVSGGVTAKTPVPKLPVFVLEALNMIDAIVVGLLPSIFACGRSVVLQKMPLV